MEKRDWIFHTQINEQPFNGQFVRNMFVGMDSVVEEIFKEAEEIRSNGGTIVEISLKHDTFLNKVKE